MANANGVTSSDQVVGAIEARQREIADERARLEVEGRAAALRWVVASNDYSAGSQVAAIQAQRRWLADEAETLEWALLEAKARAAAATRA